MQQQNQKFTSFANVTDQYFSLRPIFVNTLWLQDFESKLVTLSGQHRSHAAHFLISEGDMNLVTTSMGDILTPTLYRNMPQRVAQFLSKVRVLPC